MLDIFRDISNWML